MDKYFIKIVYRKVVFCHYNSYSNHNNNGGSCYFLTQVDNVDTTY